MRILQKDLKKINRDYQERGITVASDDSVLAPIIEELAFRAFLFNAFSRYASLGVAAVVSGVLFGLVHAASAQQLLTVALPLALGGVVLAGVYSISRCYWSNVISHALFNSISLVAVFVFHVKP